MKSVCGILWLNFFLLGTSSSRLRNKGAPVLARSNAFNTTEDLDIWKQRLEREISQAERISAVDDSFEIDGSLIKATLQGFFYQVVDKLECEFCKGTIKFSSRLARIDKPKKKLLEILVDLCVGASSQPKSVCEGITQSTGPALIEVLKNIDANNPIVPAMSCYAFAGLCPMPEVGLTEISLPPLKEYKPKVDRSGKYKYVMHITDLHYDNEYTEGAEVNCNKPLCCQRDSNSDMSNKSILKPAKKWGEYTCDINSLLLDSMMKHAAKIHRQDKFDMVMFTGDLPAHAMWKEEREKTSKEESDGLRFIDRNIFPNTTHLYPAVGNHEAVPVNLFPMKGEVGYDNYYLYKFLANEWQDWIPKPALESLTKGGFYSTMHNQNLKIITLNNNLYYTLNFYNVLQFGNPDPNGMLAWLVNELKDAEEKGLRVYIASHIPPGSKDIYPHWSNSYYKIIQRFAHVITGQFYGHEHWDEFELFYSGETKSKETAVSTGYLTPDMSTFGGTNPGYRIYKVDSNTYEVVDYIQYYADLSEQDSWGEDAEWKILYTARSVYGKGMPMDKYPTLSPAFWHQVTENLAEDPELFNTFYALRNKNGVKLPECDSECRKEFVCTLRAGKSGDNCAPVNPFG